VPDESIVRSGYKRGCGNEDRLVENVTLNFAKVSVDYTPQKDDGSAGMTIPFGWDIAANNKE
jgi:type VI secretion system secreted protein Hcp